MVRSFHLFLALLLMWSGVSQAQTTTTISRLQLAHPDLGYPGGAPLHTALESMYTKIGDNINSRYFESSGVVASHTTTYTHNLGVAFTELNVVLYTGISTSKVRVSDYIGSGWTIAANGSNPKTQIDVTTPSGGGPYTYSIVITNGDPLATRGDLYVKDSTGRSAPLPIGSSGKVLKTNGTDPSWGQILNADLDPAAGIVDTKLATIATAGKVSNSATTATSSSTNSAIVARDGSGNFSANAVTVGSLNLGTSGAINWAGSGAVNIGASLGSATATFGASGGTFRVPGTVSSGAILTDADSIVLNNDAIGSSFDYKATISRPTTGMSGNIVITTPTTTDTLVGKATFDTLTNKIYAGTSNVAASGMVRLGNADQIAWRNAANSADLTLGLSTNTLVFGANAVATAANNLSLFSSTTSSQLAGVLSDETGTGAAVFATSPALVTPTANSLGITGTSGLGYVELQEQGSAVSAPAATKIRLYPKTSDEGLYFQNSAGTETQVGSGSGEKNYLSSGSSTASAWNASGAGITVGTDIVTADLPRPNTTKTALTITGASGSTAYAYYRFILDDADAGQPLKIVWAQKPVTGYADGDLKINVYSNTASDYTTGNTPLALVGDVGGTTTIPSVTGLFQSSFIAPAIGAKWVEVRIGLNRANTHAINLSDIVVGPSLLASVVSPVRYTQSSQVVAALGTAGELAAGHTLAAASFPVSTGKIAFWNGASASDNSAALSCTSGTAACNLTNNGTVPFTGTGYAGAANTAATFNGTTQYLSSSDAFFNPGNGKSFAVGGWVKSTTWTPAAAAALWSNTQSGTDLTYTVLVNTNGDFLFRGTNSSSSYDRQVTVSNPGFTAGTWHHVAMVYDYSAGLLKGYLDGRLVGSGTLANVRSATSTTIRFGAEQSTPASFFAGSMQDVFFHNPNGTTALTDDDIRKLYSKRIDHNLNVTADKQLWSGNWSRADGKIWNQLPSDWIVHKDSNSLYADLSGLGSTALVDFKMQDMGITAQVIASNQYDSGYLSAAPATTIAHGLPDIPTAIAIRYETSTGSFVPLNPGDYCNADVTNLTCDWTGLTISASNRIRITAAVGAQALALTPADTTHAGTVTTGSQSITGQKTLTSTGDYAQLLQTTGTNNAVRLDIQNGNGTTSGRYEYVTAESLETTPQRWDFGMYGTKDWTLRDVTGSRSPIIANQSDGSVTLGTGLKFTGATPSGSVTSYTMSAYEEGAFTPVIYGSSTGNIGNVTYGGQVGQYTRVGKTVFFSLFVQWTNWTGTPTGAISISGLPYNVKNTVNGTVIFPMEINSVVLPASTISVVCEGVVNNPVLLMVANRDSANATSILAQNNTGATTRSVFVTGSYMTN